MLFFAHVTSVLGDSNNQKRNRFRVCQQLSQRNRVLTMPLKKKGSKKRKKTPSSGRKSVAADVEDKDGGQELADPSTLITSTQTAANEATSKSPKKGKKKKKRLTKSERAQVKIEKAITKLKQDHAFYKTFIERMHRWLVNIAPHAIELFKQIDTDGEGAVTVEEFKSGMFDLNAPLTRTEMHLLTRLLDADDSGEIDYTHLQQGLEMARETFELDREAEGESQVLQLTNRKFPPCKCCKMSIIEPYHEPFPKYLSIELRMVTFDAYKDYPGHFEVVVHSHLPIHGLIQIILEETQITTSKLAIFRNPSRSREAHLLPSMTLEECGFMGDSHTNPEEITLFYDYTVEFNDCPILLCDHYFGQKVKI